MRRGLSERLSERNGQEHEHQRMCGRRRGKAERSSGSGVCECRTGAERHADCSSIADHLRHTRAFAASVHQPSRRESFLSGFSPVALLVSTIAAFSAREEELSALRLASRGRAQAAGNMRKGEAGEVAVASRLGPSLRQSSDLDEHRFNRHRLRLRGRLGATWSRRHRAAS